MNLLQLRGLMLVSNKEQDNSNNISNQEKSETKIPVKISTEDALGDLTNNVSNSDHTLNEMDKASEQSKDFSSNSGEEATSADTISSETNTDTSSFQPTIDEQGSPNSSNNSNVVDDNKEGVDNVNAGYIEYTDRRE